MQPNNSIHIVQGPRIGGKGRLIAEYAQAAGINPYFTGYQCGWIGFGPHREDIAGTARQA
jgi:hypothetical protein